MFRIAHNKPWRLKLWNDAWIEMQPFAPVCEHSKIPNLWRRVVSSGQDLEDCRWSGHQQLFPIKDGRHCNRAYRGKRHSCGFPGGMTRPLKATQPALRKPPNSRRTPVIRCSPDHRITSRACLCERHSESVFIIVKLDLYLCVGETTVQQLA